MQELKRLVPVPQPIDAPLQFFERWSDNRGSAAPVWRIPEGASIARKSRNTLMTPRMSRPAKREDKDSVGLWQNQHRN
jgi:hypothetical protein